MCKIKLSVHLINYIIFDVFERPSIYFSVADTLERNFKRECYLVLGTIDT